MVEENVETSIPEEDGERQINNDNGKRAADEPINEAHEAKRVRTKSLYRQPTVNELNRLKETESLFNSNLFRLQVDEIIEEVKVKEKIEKKFHQFFTELKSHLLAIPEDNNKYDLSTNQLLKKLKVRIPVNAQLLKTKCVFKFHKFSDVEIKGSYGLGCPINCKLIVDVQITVPSETYTKNDSINYRYHKKRAAYLAFIASHLSNLETIENLQYSYINSCETKPVLDFKPVGKLGNHLSVRIHLVCGIDAYQLHRFSPERNNVRETWLFNENAENIKEVVLPTPFYNSSVLSDLTASVNEELLNDILPKSENLKQAVVLLKIWLRQRYLQVSGYVVSLLVAYYVQNKRINNIMSSYQIVRNIWIALKASEFDERGITLHQGDDPTPSLAVFHHHFPIVFLDKTGYYNLLWQMDRGTYLALKQECELAVEMLDNGKINSFLPLFLTPVKPLMKFDHVLRFKDLSQVMESVYSVATRDFKLNYGVEKLSLVVDLLYTLLDQGLGNRVDIIQPIIDADLSWPLRRSLGKAKRLLEPQVSFGFVLNPANALNVVEKGPAANLPEAEEFREFWGNKSELRRFQDGSITETCVWEGEAATERRTVTKQIIDYLMELKFGIDPSQLYHVTDQADSVLARKQYRRGARLLYIEDAALAALQAFDELRRDLRQLKELPLDISAVYGVSSIFSYSSPVPALPGAPLQSQWKRDNACLVEDAEDEDGVAVLPEYTPACKVVVELGHSGKWPGDIEAFRCLKAAFHLQIAESLTKQCSLPTQASATHVDVLKRGLVFRLQVAHPKEITLLRRETENGVVKYKESEESERLQRETVLLPRLRGALHGLQQKQPSFGGTACLFQRWLSAQLLSPPHFPAPLAELLAAAVFLQPQPARPPVSTTVGLYRVLKLLAEFDWERDVMVLDFNDDLTREDITKLEQQFDPEEQPCMRIVTPYDGPAAAPWSRAAPSPPVLARAVALAGAALTYMEDAVMMAYEDSVLKMFVPSLEGYDVLIHLYPSLVPHAHERVHCVPRLQHLPKDPVDDVIPVVDFHPVLKYLEELRSAYSEFALFFHDLYGGDVIAVLWKPDINDDREFQLTHATALKPVTTDGETKFRVNKEALIEDFRILGAGLVDDVTVN